MPTPGLLLRTQRKRRLELDACGHLELARTVDGAVHEAEVEVIRTEVMGLDEGAAVERVESFATRRTVCAFPAAELLLRGKALVNKVRSAEAAHLRHPPRGC